MNFLVIGDPHGRPQDLEDLGRLFDGTEGVIEEVKPGCLVITGDQFHNHALVHIDVASFYKKRLTHLHAEYPNMEIIVLSGNHDVSGDESSKSSAMEQFSSFVTVLGKEQTREWFYGVGFMSYFAKEKDFRAAISAMPNVTKIFCHQSFQGCQFENGMYDPHGFSLSGLEHIKFISGHVHMRQAFGNVQYVGAPRWMISSDANQEKAISLYDEDFNEIQSWDTSVWCSKIYQLVIKQGVPVHEFSLPKAKDSLIVELHGDKNWIEETSKKYKNCRVRPFRTDRAAPVISERDGIDKAFSKYLSRYRAPMGVEIEELRELCQKRLN